MFRHSIARIFRPAVSAVTMGAALLLAAGIPVAALSDQSAQTATAGTHSGSSGAHSINGSEHRTTHSRRHAQARSLPAKPSPNGTAPQIAAVPAPPQLPKWPMNDKPIEATVSWDSHGLSVNAHNSSLRQILSDISTDTGAQLEGPTPADVRVFGVYGPGPASEVISQLLNGTGYNVLMVGDQGSGAPRQIVLSTQPSGPAPPNEVRSSSDEDNAQSEPEPEPVAQPAMNNGFAPQPRTTQQMEDMQLRQEQMQQQLREQMLQRTMPPDDSGPPQH